MENYRDFQGNDLDECISKATDYFGCPREGLEIEIVQDAKSGIFGIVGARKAKIRARRIHVQEAVANILGTPPRAQKDATRPSLPIPERSHGHSDPAKSQLPKKKAPAKDREQTINPPSEPEIPSNENQGSSAEAPKAARVKVPFEPPVDSWPYKPWEELDHAFLEEKLVEIIQEMVGKIAGKPVNIRVDLSQGKPRAIIEWKGDAGLLIGREGQTLASLQYLASRMLSHAMGATLRVQLDIGNYRMRQDDNLREMAKALATRVRKSGKPMSTRPLSSYHRRVIHVCLHPDPDVQTKSIGEGPLKRVLISPKRSCLPL